MYMLYVEFCNDAHKKPVKESFYRRIFCTEYNLYFHAPKKDRCDVCEEVKLKKKEYELHIEEKEATRNEKIKDRESGEACLVFDLQNVLPCPKAEITNFFRKRKLNLYDLTAILSSTKQVYCAEWHELLMGRSGNDLASALIKILEAVFAENRNLNNLIPWSDSCVPQNRNSLMSYAIAYFLKLNPSIQSITMKFSTPGHSFNRKLTPSIAVLRGFWTKLSIFHRYRS
nr:unnamed protein product [Callosobruchus analis]